MEQRCGTACCESVVFKAVLKLLSNSSQNDDRTSRWHCKQTATLVLATALAVSSDGFSIAVGLDKKGLQILKCPLRLQRQTKFVGLRLQRQAKFVEPLIACRRPTLLTPSGTSSINGNVCHCLLVGSSRQTSKPL